LGQGEGNQRGPVGIARVAFCGCGYERIFEPAPALIHLAAGDFFGRGVDEAELADGEVVVCVAHGWAEGAALNRARGVKIAGAGGGIKYGARLVVGEVVEGLFVVRLGEERTGGGVAGEVWGEAFARDGGAGADAIGERGLGCVESGA